MKTPDFMKMVEARQEYCRHLLAGEKDEEYTRNDDKLHNFKDAGLMLGKPATSALLGMWIKHLVSIKDMILDYESTGKVPTKKMLDDKIGDAINYLHLLEGLFVEVMPGSIAGGGWTPRFPGIITGMRIGTTEKQPEQIKPIPADADMLSPAQKYMKEFLAAVSKEHQEQMADILAASEKVLFNEPK